MDLLATLYGEGADLRGDRGVGSAGDIREVIRRHQIRPHKRARSAERHVDARISDQAQLHIQEVIEAICSCLMKG